MYLCIKSIIPFDECILFMESIASVSIKTIYSITMLYLSGVVSLS